MTMGSQDFPCRINDLPDDVLLHILTFLPFETAWQTRLLSARWRRLRIPLRSLHVDAGDFESMDRFFEVLFGFLLSHASELNSFSLNVTLESDSEREGFMIICWIIVVVAVNKVKELCLEMHRRDDPAYFYNLAIDPLHSGSIERLTLIGCTLIEPPASTMRLSLLKSLSLQRVFLYQSQLDEALRCCPCLESLSLEQLKGMTPEMKIHAPQLRHLDILESSFLHLEIVAPCLMSLEFDCCEEKEEDFSGLHCVININAGGCCRLKKLKACSGALWSLGKQPSQFVELQSISIRKCPSRELRLRDDIMPVARSSQSMREIWIGEFVTFYFPDKPVEAFDIDGLQSVAFHSFCGRETVFEWMRAMIATISSLESFRITLDSMEESRLEATMSELRRLQTEHPRVIIDIVLPMKK